MIRSMLAAAALLTMAGACTPAARDEPADASATAMPEAGIMLPPEATGFITANPPPGPDATGIRRDDYGRPYEYALLGRRLPRLTGTMMDGTPFDSASLDKWTVIDVWGLWCSDCLADAPFVAALVRAIDQDPDLDFLSIHVPASATRTSAEEMFKKYGSLEAYFAEKGYAYPVLVDTDASLRDALEIAWTPSYLLVSPDGVVKGYRTEFSAAGGEPIKDFLKDVARVKAEARQAVAGGLRIGPGGVAGLPAGTPFTMDAIEAAFPGYQVVSVRQGADGDAGPAFEVREGGETLLALTPDWSLGHVARLSTVSPRVAGPDGERVGTFRLADLAEAERALCREAGAGLECPDADDQGFLRIFTPGADGVLAEMAYAFSLPGGHD